LSTAQVLQRIYQRFDLIVHRRSLERALSRRKKKRQPSRKGDLATGRSGL
jgi:hypothetical protein